METTFICDQLFYLHIETIQLLGDDPKPNKKMIGGRLRTTPPPLHQSPVVANTGIKIHQQGDQSKKKPIPGDLLKKWRNVRAFFPGIGLGLKKGKTQLKQR